MQRWSTVALLVVVLVAPSCRETTHRARSFDCDCSWLSDYDDASGQRVTVCAASDEDAKQAAEGCAQSAAPAPIQGCHCWEKSAETPCKLGDCTAHAHR